MHVIVSGWGCATNGTKQGSRVQLPYLLIAFVAIKRRYENVPI